MIPRDKIHDVLFAADMKEVAESCGVRLHKSGTVLYKGLCPFHDEKDGSFFVNTNHNRYTCYGCGRRGNAFDFLMELKGYSFVEAVKYLAEKCDITIVEHTPTKEEEQREKLHRKQLAIYEEAAKFYEQCLQLNHEVTSYALSCFGKDMLEQFRIGYAPGEINKLYQHFRSKGYLPDELEECGLFQKRKDSFIGDYFRNRLMLPVFDLTGNVIAFTGRTLQAETGASREINSIGNSALCAKDGALFGMNFVYRHIRNADMSILWEESADVVRMYQLGVCNVTAPCGMALTDEQIRLLGRASKNITLVYDGESSDMQTVERNGKRLVESGFNVYVLELSHTEDTESRFASKEDFDRFFRDRKRLFLEVLAERRKPEVGKDPFRKIAVIREISSLFFRRPLSDRSTLLEVLTEIIPSKNLWKQILKELDQAKEPQGVWENGKRYSLKGKTEEQEELIRKYGFYMENNCYYFHSSRGNAFFKASNFILEPLFHISSTVNAKRLYRLTNVFGTEQVLELNQRDLISLSTFKLRCESMGNFLFDGGERGLNKIKAYLYDNTRTCEEIVQMGWKKQHGFFAWSNGISADGNFTPTDDLGVVKHDKLYYYIPALSSFYMHEDTLFQFERKFVHKDGDISLFDFADRMLNVYGENAIAGLGFYFATLFRDIFVTTFRFFPILNIFGPKGTGKSEMAVSLLRLFGNLPVGINMTNSTVPALADHVARTCNALCHIDEYKNSLDREKIEFLKGLWDGVGRTRMNMEKDKKKEMTAVDAGVILTGQEMASEDNALFSRVVFLTVSKTEFTEEERCRFEELKVMESRGLTHITNRLLAKRKLFLENHVAAYNEAIADVTPFINKPRIEDRILKNWCVVLSALKLVLSEETLPFTYEKAVRTFARMITRQNSDVVSGNEVSDFWSTYQELFSSGFIEKDYDFVIKEVEELKTATESYHKRMKVLFMNPNRIFGLYAQQKRSTNEKKLPKDSLKYYLRNSGEYLGQQQRRFRRNTKNLQEKESAVYMPGDGTVALEYERPFAWCFDYDKLRENMDLMLETDFVWESKEEISVTDGSPKNALRQPDTGVPKLSFY